MSSKILIVEDDATLVRFLSECLQQNDFEVATAANGPEAVRQAYSERPDLVLLDVMMPGMDGWETCARLRELSDFPVIMVTAKSSEADKLRGFRLGVDDYVTKPFSFAELAARIRAVLARTESARGQMQRVHAAGDLIVDVDKRQVRLAGKIVPVTPTEFRVLAYLIEKHGQTISEEELIREVWSTRESSDASIVRRYIWLIRRKIEPDPSHPAYILTMRGFGYRLGTTPLGPLDEK
ncbi:MAG: response regulator transcription factor [Chloroflexi bacterium]|nr:response regulator transcription factor [Chloroflexota bacterium]MBI3761301.1 response regulator transcription factor [Chloroflexota bacterium]